MFYPNLISGLCLPVSLMLEGSGDCLQEGKSLLRFPQNILAARKANMSPSFCNTCLWRAVGLKLASPGYALCKAIAAITT